MLGCHQTYIRSSLIKRTWIITYYCSKILGFVLHGIFVYNPLVNADRFSNSLLFLHIYNIQNFLNHCHSHNCWCHYTKSNPIDDHSNISSKTLQKQNFKPVGHYTCMQCGTSHLQNIQENILSHIILATYRKFTVTTVRFTQNVSCNIYIHPIYQQVAICHCVIIHQTTKYIG